MRITESTESYRPVTLVAGRFAALHEALTAHPDILRRSAGRSPSVVRATPGLSAMELQLRLSGFRLLSGAVLTPLRRLRDIGQALLARLGRRLSSEHTDPTASLNVLVGQHDNEVDDRHEDDEVNDG